MRYVLEYSSNEKVMGLYGPKVGRSLFKNRSVDIKYGFDLRVRDTRYTFENTEGKGFSITPMDITQKRNKLTLVTKRNTYVFTVM